MLDEVLSVSSLTVHPGRRLVLRSPEWNLGLVRSLTEHIGGFGGAVVADRYRGRFGRGLAYSGRVIEAVSRGPETLRADRGRPIGVEDGERLDSAAEGPNHACFVDWLERITGLTPFDLDNALVRRPPRRVAYELIPDGLTSEALQVTTESVPRVVVAMFIDPETYQDVALPLLDDWATEIALTPPRLSVAEFKRTSISFALAQREMDVQVAQLDAIMKTLRCTATAVAVAGNGAPTRWWDWESGAPTHGGEVLGAADFIEVWSALAVSLGTWPHVFSRPWPSVATLVTEPATSPSHVSTSGCE